MLAELLNLQPLAAADWVVLAGLLVVAAGFVVVAAVGCGDVVKEQPAALLLLANYVLLWLADYVLLQLADCLLLLLENGLLLLENGLLAVGAVESAMVELLGMA